jgi:hypothetical protein
VRNAIRGGEGAWPPRCCQGEHGEIGEALVEWLMDGRLLDAYHVRVRELGVNIRDRVVSIRVSSFEPDVPGMGMLE